jgi:hypothetical protein
MDVSYDNELTKRMNELKENVLQDCSLAKKCSLVEEKAEQTSSPNNKAV